MSARIAQARAAWRAMAFDADTVRVMAVLNAAQDAPATAASMRGAPSP
jgi:hypothetical protein